MIVYEKETKRIRMVKTYHRVYHRVYTRCFNVSECVCMMYTKEDYEQALEELITYKQSNPRIYAMLSDKVIMMFYNMLQDKIGGNNES